MKGENMKKVAFVRTTNIYDDSRATKEISALSEAGYHVIVLGWDRNGEAEVKTKKTFEGLNVEFRFFHCLLPTGIGIKNVDKLIKWVIWTKKELKEIDNLYAIHACNLDGGIGAFQFCKKNCIPLVYDIYDYYIDSHSIPKMIKGLIEGMEINIINFADTTFLCTEERRAQIKKATPKNVVIIHNSPDVPEIGETVEKYDYAYCGSLCDLRLIKEILDNYYSNNDLRFAFAGNDKYQKDVEKLAEKYNNIDYYGTIPYAKVLEIEKSAKVLSAIYEPSIRNHQLCAPNKFYEALALGKPLIVCEGTGIDKVVKENNIGEVIHYDAKEFYKALERLISDDNVRRSMGERARALYASKYAWHYMKAKIVDVYSGFAQ